MITIDRLELIRFELPLSAPFTTAFGTIDRKSSILVKLYSEDLVGIGEGATLSAPLYSPEYDIVAFEVIKRFMAPAIVGRAFTDASELLAAISFVRGYSYARTAIETAFWDLFSRVSNAPLQRILGGSRDMIPVGESIGITTTIDKLLDVVGVRLSEGYKRVKLKIRPGWDIEPVRAIRREFGDIPLMVDGNSGYSRREADVFRALDEYGLMMIEQPLGADDLVDHAELQSKLETPICLDESILSVDDARRAIAIGACRIINVKPGRVGGVSESKKIHDLCFAAGIPLWCGGLLESCVGRFYNLVIASLPGFSLPADMSPSSLFFLDDLVENPFSVRDGEVRVPQSLDEFRIDPSRIEAYTREIYRLSSSANRP